MKIKSVRRLLCAMLVVLFVFPLLTQPISSQDSLYNNFQKRYDIAIVFDNSGSMYQNTERWCRAKYAMEIFASMLHYENGDMLTIYPMWKTVTDGSQPSAKGSGIPDISVVEPIVLREKDDINKISNLYTIFSSHTPYEPVEEAYQALQASDAQEKWLVILSDGEFNYEKRLDAADSSKEKKIAGEELQSRLEAMASERIKVQYLGFGSSSAIDEKRALYLYAAQSNDANLRSKLVDICNVIFQRSDLLEQAPTAFDEKTGKLTFDMSMRSLIVFAQGENAVIRGLKNEEGSDIAVSLDSGQRTYSEISSGNHGLPGSGALKEDAKLDKSLAGQVVTFTDCAAGTYQLDVSGQTELQIFYEPDVEIAYSFTGDDGEIYNSLNELPAQEILPGEYIVRYWIADSKTHEDVTKSPLLGSNVAFTAEVEHSDGRIEEIINGGGVVLEPEQSVFMKITGNYLNQYRISTEDDRQNATLYVTAPEKEILGLALSQTQPHDWYKQADWADWEPIRADLTLSGCPLTDEQLASVTFQPEFTGDEVSCQFRMLPGESAYEILLCRDDTGAYAEAPVGERTMTVKASFTDVYDRLLKTENSVKYKIELLGFWTVTISVCAVIACAVLLWLFYMTRKVMPKRMERASGTTSITFKGMTMPVSNMVTKYNCAQRTLKIGGGQQNNGTRCVVTLILKPVDNRFTPSARRRVRLVGLTGGTDGLTDVRIDGSRIQRKDFENPGELVFENANIRLNNEDGGEIRFKLEHL